MKYLINLTIAITTLLTANILLAEIVKVPARQQDESTLIDDSSGDECLGLAANCLEPRKQRHAKVDGIVV